MANAKFKFGDLVTVDGDEGTIEEVSDTICGKKWQYRVRVDFSDSWHPEADLKMKKKAPVDGEGEGDTPPVPPVKPTPNKGK